MVRNRLVNIPQETPSPAIPDNRAEAVELLVKFANQYIDNSNKFAHVDDGANEAKRMALEQFNEHLTRMYVW